MNKLPDPEVIGNFSQISSICLKNRVNRIVVALDERRGKLPIQQLLVCRLKGIQIDEGNAFSEQLCGKLSVESLYPSTLIFSERLGRPFVIKKLKRGMDLFFSLAGVFLFLPVVFVIAWRLNWKPGAHFLPARKGRGGRR